MTDPGVGRTSADDPGLLRSMGSGTTIGQMRALGLVFAAVPVLIGMLLPLVVRGSDRTLDVTAGVAAVAATAAVSVLAQAVAVPRQFAPAPAPGDGAGEDAGASAIELAREGVQQLRAAMFLRLALSETAVLVGFIMSALAGDLLPYAVGFVLGWPLMLRAVPTARQVERARARMESRGVRVPLWDVLLAR